MKIERLSENSIRCTLTSFDLSVRDLNIRELAYGTDKVKKLFTEMMTRASNEVGFETDGTPIMIEAIPLTNDSIQLVITKVNDPEELDARFSRFSPGAGGPQNPKGRGEDWLHRLTSELLEGASGFIAQMQQMQAANNQMGKTGAVPGPGLLQGAKQAPVKPGEKPEEPAIPEHSYRAIGFEDLDTVFEAARAAAFYQGDSKLYKKPETNRYVLMVHGTKENHTEYAKACNILAEYGYSIHTTPGTDSYYEEHYDLISKSPAIVRLSGVGEMTSGKKTKGKNKNEDRKDDENRSTAEEK